MKIASKNREKNRVKFKNWWDAGVDWTKETFMIFYLKASKNISWIKLQLKLKNYNKTDCI